MIVFRLVPRAVTVGGRVFSTRWISACVIPVILHGVAAAGEVNADFTSATAVPVTASGYTASGNTVNLSLSFAPDTGTSLTVVRNTGIRFIEGEFSNLAHGRRVDLTHNGIAYPFVANYYGGSGNDLVLQWANTQAFVWGGYHARTVPAPADLSGALRGKTILALAGGRPGSGGDTNHRAILVCADGSLVGINDREAVGEVARTGALAGKTVAAVAVGSQHYLALCTDGTVAAWGENGYGQLGDNTLTTSWVPVAVDRTGALAGRSVVAIAAGGQHSLALCDDGTLVAWGYNYYGQLGNGGTVSSGVPVAVTQTGVLAGREVTALSACLNGSMALCADGAIATWGSDIPLGTSESREANVPGLVDQSGVLAGKTVTAIAAGSPCVALCQDGTFVAWGGYFSGTGVTNGGPVPALVSRSGPLGGKEVTSISAGNMQVLAGCADGTAAAWGYNLKGQLGIGSTGLGANAPVAVLGTNLPPGARFMTVADGACHDFCVAMAALAPAAVIDGGGLAETDDTGASLRADIWPNGLETAVWFEYGPTAAYGSMVLGTPAALTGTGKVAVAAELDGLPPGSSWHYRVVAKSASGVVFGQDRTFATTSLAPLASLALDVGTLSPGFAPERTRYTCSVDHATSACVLSAMAADPGATVEINGGTGTTVPLVTGDNPVAVRVTAADGIHTRTYRLNVVRLPETLAFDHGTAVPVTASGFQASGRAAGFSLGFSPLPGTHLKVVDNTGDDPIAGEFSNLPQGGQIALTYQGVAYPFVADYFGGDGNDLVLRWAAVRLLGWGSNASGQLGNGGTATSKVPVPAATGGALAGKLVTQVAAGGTHNLALCTDGTLAVWGNNSRGQLGLGGFAPATRTTPVLVSRTGPLAGKTVIAVAAGYEHSLVLCADGELVTWGAGDPVPSRVDRTGVLANKRVVAIDAGLTFSVALGADGLLATWEAGAAKTPVAVDATGVLLGKPVASLAFGYAHALALCRDGTLAAWGSNAKGELGNNSTDRPVAPVLVDRGGVLQGARVVGVAAGQECSLALCADGTLATWGINSNGQLGINNVNPNPAKTPLAVYRAGVLADKSARAVWSGSAHMGVVCADGSLATWGSNSVGQLGDNGTAGWSMEPVLVSSSALRSGERWVAAWSFGAHTLALAASPPPPAAVTNAASQITATGATLNGSVVAAHATTTISFEYGPTPAFGSTVAAIPGTATGSAPTAANALITGLSPGVTYHFRVVASNPHGLTYGDVQTFTASQPPVFAGLTAATAWQTPVDIPLRKLLAKASDPEGGTVTLTAAGPASAHGGTVVLLADAIRYTPPNNFSGADTFTVVLADAGGASVTGTVMVAVGQGPNAGDIGGNPPALTVLPDGKVGISCQGIPGRTYTVQRSIGGLNDWETLASATADASGKVSFIDDNPPPGSAFYRLWVP